MNTERKTGVELIAEERATHPKRGYDAMHDSDHDDESLAYAAICYAMPPLQREEEGVTDKIPHDYWAWEREDWKPLPNDRIRELVIAGSLIAAEIDRLQTLNS